MTGSVDTHKSRRARPGRTIRGGAGGTSASWKMGGWLVSLVLALGATESLLVPGVQAHSQRLPPLKRITHLSDSSIEILPRHVPLSSSLASSRSSSSSVLRKREAFAPPARELQHDDSLLLRFSIPTSEDPDQEEPLVLSLRPTEDLIHPDAVVHYHSAPSPIDGSTTITTVPLHRSSVRAYTGWVIHPSHSSSWWTEEASSISRSHWDQAADSRVLGWARVMVHNVEEMEYDDDSEGLSWEGAFEVDGHLWQVRTADGFSKVRSDDDPEPEWWSAHPHGGLVAWREADIAFPGAGSGSHEEVTSCAHDSLDYNVSPLNPVLSSARQKAFLADPYGPNASPLMNYIDDVFGLPSMRRSVGHPLTKRQTGGDINGGTDVSSNFAGSIGSTSGCPLEARIVFMGVAADCTYVNKYGSQDSARTQILSNLNSASALYQKTFNVSLGVVELAVMNSTCPTAADPANPWNVGCEEGGGAGLDLNSRLSVFSKWRGEKGGGDGAGLWHLMSNCSTGSEVGVAWLGQLCQMGSQSASSGQTTSGTGVTTATSSEWQVLAHEVGHNFGAIHDCASGCSLSGSCCPFSTTSCNANANFIMSPVSARNTSTFSPCSIGNVCSMLGSGLNVTCLARPGQRSVISLQQCGNGIVEPGEDCDPGADSSTSCCNPRTCKFAAGAVCDPTSSSCCTSTCGFASAATVCRPSMNVDCDMPETCTGNSSACPSDVTKSDGDKCGAQGAGLTCAAGMCTSRDAQCASAGAQLGISKACQAGATSTCQISCADPSSDADCILLSSNFVDGTDCGYGGRCKDGVCQSGSFLDRASSWYRQNLQIAIPVTVVGGILILLLFFSLVRCCLRRKAPPSRGVMAQRGPTLAANGTPVFRRGSRALRRGGSSRVRGSNGSGHGFPPPPQNYGNGGSAMSSQQPIWQPQAPPPVHPASGGGGGGGWVDPTAYNGPNYPHPR